MTYGDVVTRFFYEAVPTLPVPPEVRFEAISAAVFGSKQRRAGPMPPPEVQVGVRDVLRHALFEGGGTLKVFAPWGASKQADGAKLDVLEFMALKQLAGLREELARFGVKTEFSFRLENHTDRWLFGDTRKRDIAEYSRTFQLLAGRVLPGALAYTESDFIGWSDFAGRADELTTAFYRVLRGVAAPESLEAFGWKGGVPEHQRNYYLETYKYLYPGEDHEKILAKYFAAALTRNTMGATAVPRDPFVFVTFAHAVPNDPVRKNRLYFRTLPEKYTHQHFAPWLTNGYLRVSAGGVCAPRFVTPDKVEDRLTPFTANFDGTEVYAPYVEE
jgi:hypothetical protein